MASVHFINGSVSTVYTSPLCIISILFGQEFLNCAESRLVTNAKQGHECVDDNPCNKILYRYEENSHFQ